jgi:hypothetical protein
MDRQPTAQTHSRGRKSATSAPARRAARGAARLAVVAAGLALSAGCNSDEAMRAFRDAATQSLSDGLKSISSGIIDGAVAVIQLGGDDSASGTSPETQASSRTAP